MSDYPSHANMLVHWTGEDIDDQYHPEWRERNSSETNPRLVVRQEDEYLGIKNKYSEARNAPPLLTANGEEKKLKKLKKLKKQALHELEERYLSRLRRILQDGLWMRLPSESECKELCAVLGSDCTPKVARVCFTELRLAHARTHARQYGRLGIGVKPPFVFDRGGRPVLYYGDEGQRTRDVFLQWFSAAHSDPTHRHLGHYLKPMRGDRSGEPYEYYDESEWRIVYTATLDPQDNAARGDLKRKDVCHACVRAAPPTQDYLAKLPQKEREAAQTLRYLLPLDGWLSCIIYPSVSLKDKALADPLIRGEIARIKEVGKCVPTCRANRVERGNWPVQIDLDLCRNL
jgi:hypothetical protein